MLLRCFLYYFEKQYAEEKVFFFFLYYKRFIERDITPHRIDSFSLVATESM